MTLQQKNVTIKIWCSQPKGTHVMDFEKFWVQKKTIIYENGSCGTEGVEEKYVYSQSRIKHKE